MDDWHVGDPLMPRGVRNAGRWWASLVFRAVLAALGLSLAYGLASAQTGRLTSCSQTVGASSTPVPFPAAGVTGPPFPTSYLEICNAHPTNTLGVNIVGGTAAIGAAGTVTLNPGGCLWWNQAVVPGNPTVIGSGAGTTTACGYR
jgi:hypothetical protein